MDRLSSNWRDLTACSSSPLQTSGGGFVEATAEKSCMVYHRDKLWQSGGALLRAVCELSVMLHVQVGVTALPACRTPAWKRLYALSADDAPPGWAEATR